MKELMFKDGDLTFLVDDTVHGFDNKLANALEIYGVETFFDTTKGINFDVISSNQGVYKLQHMRNKLWEWYKNELEFLELRDIHISNKVAKATLYYKHKTLGENSKEVVM